MTDDFMNAAADLDLRGGAPPNYFPLTRRDLALVFAFWTFIAALTAANGLLDPRGRGLQPVFSAAPVALAFIGAYLWAVLTPPIFWLGSRLSVERSDGEPSDRVAPALLLLVVGVLVAIAVDALLAFLRFDVFEIRRGRGPGPGPGGTPPPFDPLFGVIHLFWIDDLIVYVAVVAAGFARDYFLRYRARREQAVRLEAQLAQARLDALRRQLDPHFLFNTLHAVSSLVERDPRGVRRMISRLSELLRYSIEGAHETEIPLRQELELLGRYLDIMQVRFQGRLEVGMKVDDRTLDALVPNLILQPLVENAIKHGVEKLTGAGRIAVEAEVAGEALVLRVRDNGPGGEVTTGPRVGSAAPEGAAGGVGLRNTVARLEQLYGSEQRFTLRGDEEGGTVAEVRLPFHTRADLRAAALPDGSARAARAG